ncbi:MAG: DUF1802 family protein [Planctomycetota bacterium]
MSGTGPSASDETLATARGCRVGLREWGVVCAAVAAGRQTVLLRKGGLADRGGRFEAEHDAFWLLPSTFHPDRDAIRDDAADLWELARGLRVGDRVTLPAFVRVLAAGHLADLDRLGGLAAFHVLTDAMVRTRFDYRRPGLTVLAVEAFVPDPLPAMTESDATGGCRSWVPFDGDATFAPPPRLARVGADPEAAAAAVLAATS